MTDLGLDQLTDDQLVGLLREILQEASRRNQLAQDALRAAILDESEKDRIAKAAAAAEAAKIAAEERARVAREAASRLRNETEKRLRDEASAKQASLWERKQKLAQRVSRAVGWKRPAQLNVWSRDGEIRVYLEEEPERARKMGKKLCLYFTGNRYHPPQSLDGSASPELRDALIAAASDWRPGLRIDIPACEEVVA